MAAGQSIDSNDTVPRRYELRNDGGWQPAQLLFERQDGNDLAGVPVPHADGPHNVLLTVDEFNIRQIETACGRNDLELRDDRGGFWRFRPRRIRIENGTFAEGELRAAYRRST
jgi:hypothetical protein